MSTGNEATADAARAVASLADAPVGLLALDADGTVLAATELAARLLGRRRSEVEGTALEPLAAPDDRPGVRDVLTSRGPSGGTRIGTIGTDGAPHAVRLRSDRSDGDAPGAPHLVVVEPAGPPLYWETDAVEPALGANPLRGVDGALSHDVRGALRGVKSFLELVARSDALTTDAKAERFLGIARSAGADADLMVEQLVRLLRVHDRPVEIDVVPLDEVVDAAIARAADPDDGGGALGRFERPSTLPSVLGNTELLTACVSEVLTNARKFGGADVAVRLDVVADEGWVWLRLSDDGPGVPEELAEDAFRLFRLLQPKGRVPGVGMGLPLCRAAAEVHGGVARLEPSPTGGTTVVIRLADAAGASGRVDP